MKPSQCAVIRLHVEPRAYRGVMPEERWRRCRVVAKSHGVRKVGGLPDMIDDGGWNAIDRREIVQLLKDLQ